MSDLEHRPSSSQETNPDIAESPAELKANYARPSVIPPEANKDKTRRIGHLPLMMGGAAVAIGAVAGGYFATRDSEKTEPKSPDTSTVQVDKMTPLERLDKDLGFDADIMDGKYTPLEVNGAIAGIFTDIINDSVDNPNNNIEERINLLTTASGREGVDEFINTAVDYLEDARDTVTTHADETNLKPENVTANLLNTLDDSEQLPNGSMQVKFTTQYTGTDTATGEPIFLTGNIEQWNTVVVPYQIELSDGQIIETLKIDSIENIPFE